MERHLERFVEFYFISTEGALLRKLGGWASAFWLLRQGDIPAAMYMADVTSHPLVTSK